MALLDARSLDAHTMRLLEIAFAVWALVWIGLAAAIAYELWTLRDLGGTLTTTGSAVAAVGRGLQSLAGIPLVGNQIGNFAHQAVVAGESVATGAQSTRSTATNLSFLIGFAVALIPTVPTLAVYVPLRMTWRRERRSVVRALREHRRDPVLEEWLARRAAVNLPYFELRAVSREPWRDIREGRYDALAAAELVRLGLPGHAE